MVGKRMRPEKRDRQAENPKGKRPVKAVIRFKKEISHRNIGDIPWMDNKGPVIQDKAVLKGVQIGKECQPQENRGGAAGEFAE